jgi:hypothetical protein
VNVSSIPANADIEIDGTFSGTTPSVLKLEPGEHHVAIKKNNYNAWERTLRIEAGASININAELTAGSAPAAAPLPQVDASSQQAASAAKPAEPTTEKASAPAVAGAASAKSSSSPAMDYRTYCTTLRKTIMKQAI